MSDTIHVTRLIDSPCYDPETGKEIPKDGKIRVSKSMHIMSYIAKGYLKELPAREPKKENK